MVISGLGKSAFYASPRPLSKRPTVQFGKNEPENGGGGGKVFMVGGGSITLAEIIALARADVTIEFLLSLGTPFALGVAAVIAYNRYKRNH